MNSGKSLNFKSRKIVHYSLIFCILLMQLALAAFFYNEFVNKKKLTFLENQLNEIHSLEKLTDDSKKELLNSQDFFQKYLITEDRKYLDSYFESVNKLTKNLDSINTLKAKNPRLNKSSVYKKLNPDEFKKLKVLIDSTHEFSNQPKFRLREELPQLKKYEAKNNFETFDIDIKTQSDTVKKKGLFGRLGDAISGNENVRREKTIITLKSGKTTTPERMKRQMDSIIGSINNHYVAEVQKVRVNITKNQDNSGRFNKIFNNLLVYSNDLMNVYESAIKDAKSNLEREYANQNSKNNKIRTNFVFGLIILMFIVSLLIMFLTRIAFGYEKQINENLKFKNRILGMLSHELRSPLKIIDIFINRINKKTTDGSIKEYLKSISFTNNTLLMQANQILEYTKNQQVENKLVPVVFNLKNEMDSIFNSIQPYIETRGNQLIVDGKISPDIEVYSDNTKINQIFMNILGNANKFTENGQISVSIFAEHVNDKVVLLKTKISDTGVGISQSDLKNIFEPYYQGVLSNDVENLGAGLGLSLCKELVKLFSGEISASSELRKGTIVDFSLHLDLHHG